VTGEGLRPDGVPGIIDGYMTINLEPGGDLSFRIIIGGDGRRRRGDLLELIIGSDQIGVLSRALAGDSTASNGAEQAPLLPCHIGFSAIPLHVAGLLSARHPGKRIKDEMLTHRAFCESR
jgi:hypothetical protein